MDPNGNRVLRQEKDQGREFTRIEEREKRWRLLRKSTGEGEAACGLSCLKHNLLLTVAPASRCNRKKITMSWKSRARRCEWRSKIKLSPSFCCSVSRRIPASHRCAHTHVPPDLRSYYEWAPDKPLINLTGRANVIC